MMFIFRIPEKIISVCDAVFQGSLGFIVRKKEEVLLPWFQRCWPSWLKPNYITVFRCLVAIAILPWIFLDDYRNNVWLALVLIFTFLTDLIDGPVARALKQETAIGSLLDKIADKLLIVPLGILEFHQPYPYLVIFSLIGMGVVLFFASLKFFSSRREVVPENIYGKLTTCLYSAGIILAIWPRLLGVGRILGWIGFAFGIASVRVNLRRHFGIQSSRQE